MQFPNPSPFFALNRLQKELFVMKDLKREAEIHFTIGLIEEQKGNFFEAWRHYLHISNDYYLLSCASTHEEIMIANLTKQVFEIAKMRAAERTTILYDSFANLRNEFFNLLKKSYEIESLEALKKMRINVAKELSVLCKKHQFLCLVDLTPQYEVHKQASYFYQVDKLLAEVIRNKKQKFDSNEPPPQPSPETLNQRAKIIENLTARRNAGLYAASIHKFLYAVAKLNHSPGAVNPAAYNSIIEYVLALEQRMKNYLKDLSSDLNDTQNQKKIESPMLNNAELDTKCKLPAPK